jgi:hypothetical protein
LRFPCATCHNGDRIPTPCAREPTLVQTTHAHSSPTTLGHLARPEFHRLHRCEALPAAPACTQISGEALRSCPRCTPTRIVPKHPDNLNEARAPHSTLTTPCHHNPLHSTPFHCTLAHSPCWTTAPRELPVSDQLIHTGIASQTGEWSPDRALHRRGAPIHKLRCSPGCTPRPAPPRRNAIQSGQSSNGSVVAPGFLPSVLAPPRLRPKAAGEREGGRGG